MFGSNLYPEKTIRFLLTTDLRALSTYSCAELGGVLD